MLLQLAEKHASKVRRNKHEAAAAGYETFVRGILSRIDSFPTQLSSSEQGDFILGYYHQQSHDIDVRVKAKQERERAKGALE
jgi:CRISPR-associated protein Csd1